jgi:predicted porin
MFGGVRGRTNLALVLGAGVFLAGGPVQAADLGSDGVADLEERVAELEATTARKGNRKVSLTVSGWVNQAVQWWDDGAESNTYVTTNGSDPSRFRFVGKAKIDKDWSAGYIIEIGVASANQSSNDADGLAASSFTLRHSAWFLESKSLGKLTVGQTSAVNDGITELSLAKTTVVDKPITIFTPNSAFKLRNSATGAALGSSWSDLTFAQTTGVGEGDRYNLVRYDSPEFGGFVASANWGEDDFWAVALKYAGEFHGFKLAAGISYGEITDNTQKFGGSSTAGNDKGTTLGGSASILHKETGLFATFAYGETELAQKAVGAGNDRDYSNWNIQAGIQRKWHPLGATTLFGEYYQGEFGQAKNTPSIKGSDVDVWGLAAVQAIDAAALELYVAYRHYEADLKGTTVTVEDFDTVFSGAKISF